MRLPCGWVSPACRAGPGQAAPSTSSASAWRWPLAVGALSQLPTHCRRRGKPLPPTQDHHQDLERRRRWCVWTRKGGEAKSAVFQLRFRLLP